MKQQILPEEEVIFGNSEENLQKAKLKLRVFHKIEKEIYQKRASHA